MGLGKITLNESSSSSSSNTLSRFLLFAHVIETMTVEVEDRVTFTAFLVPGRVEDVQSLWKDFRKEFYLFKPRGYESLTFRETRHRDTASATWLYVVSEDSWVEKKFGKQEEQAGDDSEGGRTILCQFHLWPRNCGGGPEKEAASVADAEGRERWNRVIARVMPPATAWVQERWDIHGVPSCAPEPPLEEPELKEAIAAFCRQQARLRESGESSQGSHGLTFKEGGR
jgi:hypothetical protein